MFKSLFPLRSALIIFGFAAGLALSFPFAAMAQSSMTSSWGDVEVSIIGNGSMSTDSGFFSFEAQYNDHVVILRRNSIEVDGESFDITAETEVVLDGSGGGFVVIVDGEQIAGTSPLQAMQAAAEAGDPASQLNLGVAYMEGEIVEQDRARAVELYRQAAEAGIPEAQSNLAYALFNGTGVEADASEAMQFAELAAEQQNAIAMRLFAHGLYNGEGIERDAGRAVRIWAAAADMGDGWSAYNMGIAVRSGADGAIVQDADLARSWFELAVELGIEEAQEALDEMQPAE